MPHNLKLYADVKDFTKLERFHCNLNKETYAMQ